MPANEVRALRDAAVLTSEQRTAIALLALGEDRLTVADALVISPCDLRVLLRTASQVLHCPARAAALVHACYAHPAHPLPAMDKRRCPELTKQQWMLLYGHAHGVPLSRLQPRAGVSLFRLAQASSRFQESLGARTSAHLVRRAWQRGLLSRRSVKNTAAR